MDEREDFWLACRIQARLAVVDGLRRFRAASFDRDAIIAHGAQWSPLRFAGRLAAVINEVL